MESNTNINSNNNINIDEEWWIFTDLIDKDCDDKKVCLTYLCKGPFKTKEDARNFLPNDEIEIPIKMQCMEEKYSRYVGKKKLGVNYSWEIEDSRLPKLNDI